MSRRSGFKAVGVVIGVLIVLMTVNSVLAYCGWYIIGKSRLVDQGGDVLWTVYTHSGDSTPTSLSTEGTLFVDNVAFAYIPQRWDHAVADTAQWKSVDREDDGLYEAFGWHNGELHCDLCGVTHNVTDTSDRILNVGSRLHSDDLASVATVQETQPADEYATVVSMDRDVFAYYPFYQRIRDGVWGSELDQQLFNYMTPAAGFVEVGDFKPLVFRHEDGDMVKVIVGKDGHYLVITVNLLDDTWASREVRR